MRLSAAAIITAAATAMLMPPGLAAAASTHQTWLIRTAAGGVGGPGPGRQIPAQPCAAAPAAGRLYVADQILTTGAGTSSPAGQVIRAISQRTGGLTTPIGDGGPGASADGTLAARAGLAPGCGLAVDHAGNVLFSQTTTPSPSRADQTVRVFAARTGRFYGRALKVGRVYTIAGNGKAGYTGEGGPALKARLDEPEGLAVDAAGNVLIEDTGDLRLRIVAERTGRFFGRAMKAGDIYTIAGDGQINYSEDGVRATSTGLGLSSRSQGIAVDRRGNVVVDDFANNRVRVIAARSGTFYGQAMTAGFIYTIAGDGSYGELGDGGPATAASIGFPQELAIDHSGNVVVSQSGACLARVIAASSGRFYSQQMTTGDIYSTGNGTACFTSGVAVDAAGNLIALGQWAAAMAVRSGEFYGRAMTAGHQYLLTSTMTASHAGDGALATRAEIWPQGIALEHGGDLLMVDFEPGVHQQGQVRLVAARSGILFGRHVTAGRIYTIAAGLGDGFYTRPLQGIAVDQFGNAIIGLNSSVDVLAVRAGTFYGQRMRAGKLYPIAGGGTGTGTGVPASSVALKPAGMAVDRDGNIVIADTTAVVRVLAVRAGRFYGQPMKAGDIYTVAGTGSDSGSERNGVPGTESVIDPVGVAIDGAGNILVTDIRDSTVRVIAAGPGKFYGQPMTAGDIYGLAGDGRPGFRGDGGPAGAAELARPCGLALDRDGNVLIGDLGNHRVRVVAARSGSFYGRAMKTGDIYTIAGIGGRLGTASFADGVAAVNAGLVSPAAVAVTASGDVLVADSYRVRVIAP